MKNVDVIVIGGGMIGLSIAYWLTKKTRQYWSWKRVLLWQQAAAAPVMDISTITQKCLGIIPISALLVGRCIQQS